MKYVYHLQLLEARTFLTREVFMENSGYERNAYIANTIIKHGTRQRQSRRIPKSALKSCKIWITILICGHCFKKYSKYSVFLRIAQKEKLYNPFNITLRIYLNSALYTYMYLCMYWSVDDKNISEKERGAAAP